MSLSNWIYLGIGLGLGLGSRWLFEQVKEGSRIRDQGSEGNEVISPPNLTFHSVSDDKQQVLALSEQLKQTQLAYQLAHEMSQFKAGFLVRTSHELRSPLNSMIGLHQLILADLCDNPAEEREFVAQAHESALKLVNLIDQILNVARTEHGTNKLAIQPLPLADVLAEVYNVTHLLAENHNFSLQLSPPEPEIYILADPRWLKQVLVNLVDTCITQMQQGSIIISTESIPAEGLTYIWIDAPLPATWSEPIDLIKSEVNFGEPLKQDLVPSPGLTLLLNQTLIEAIKGRLEIMPISSDQESPLTRIQLTIPLVIPETGSLE